MLCRRHTGTVSEREDHWISFRLKTTTRALPQARGGRNDVFMNNPCAFVIVLRMRLVRNFAYYSEQLVFVAPADVLAGLRLPLELSCPLDI